jgi:hypothetical protein
MSVCLEISGYIAEQFTSSLKGNMTEVPATVDDHVERVE